MAHVDDWSRYEAVLLIVSQMVVCLVVGYLIMRRFETAFFIALGYAIALGVIGSVAKSL